MRSPSRGVVSIVLAIGFILLPIVLVVLLNYLMAEFSGELVAGHAYVGGGSIPGTLVAPAAPETLSIRIDTKPLFTPAAVRIVLDRQGLEDFWDPFSALKFRYSSFKLIVGIAF